MFAAVAGTQCAQHAIRESTKTKNAGFFWMTSSEYVFVASCLAGCAQAGSLIEFFWLVWCLFAHSVASMVLGNAWKCPPPNSDNSCLGSLFPLVPLGTALKTTSKHHAYSALASSLLCMHTELSFLYISDSFGVVFGCCWDPVCPACFQGKHEHENYWLLLDDLF